MLWADLILPFVPDGEYLIWASICRAFRQALRRRPKMTTMRAILQSVPLVEWAYTQGCASFLAEYRLWVCEEIAYQGNLQMLQWARAHDFPWDVATCRWAAFRGHLPLLQWARQNGCPWDATICQWAAYAGHLDLLQWARENGCPQKQLRRVNRV